ncbi:twitching motility protein PilT, partial [bacterium]
ESLGVPHPEIAAIQVNGQPAGLDQIAQSGETVKVSPYEPGDPRVCPVPLCFVLDSHLGRLASYLRILGFDVLYDSAAGDETLATLSGKENRVLLTRDRGLLKRSLVTYGYCIRDQNPRNQLLEVFQRYDLRRDLRPFTRCPRCNGLIHPVDKAAVAGLLLENTLAHVDQFWQCGNCGKVYWQGSHYERMQNWLGALQILS